MWEVLAVLEETGSVHEAADHFRWPRVVVTRARGLTPEAPRDHIVLLNSTPGFFSIV